MKLRSIQVLRGLAALLVVLFHIRSLEGLGIAGNGATEQTLTGGALTNGYAGVDLFFVISGFIMVYVTDGMRHGVKPAADFLFARATRIFPVWWAFAGFMTVYIFAAHGTEGFGMASQGVPAVSYLVRSFLLQPQPAFPVLGVGWTLVHEMYFYIAFTLLMLLPRKWLPALIGVWGLTIIAGTLVGYAVPYAGTYRDLIFYPMTMEFILGAAAGLAVTSGLVWRAGVVTLGASLWLAVALCYQGMETEFTLKWGRVLWFGLPCAVLIYGVASLEARGRIAWLIPAAAGLLAALGVYQMFGLHEASPDALRRDATLLSTIVGGIAMLIVLWFGWLLGQGAPALLLRTQPFFEGILRRMVRLGDWSFSLYLIHMIVMSAMRRIFDLLGKIDALAPVFRLGHEGPLDNVAFIVACLASSLVTAALTYRFLERPAIRFFSKMREQIFYQKRDLLEPA
ncbi:MAG: acyltransferase [Hyphomonas sp.]|uniref:acyltransferase family protein n=1 Tax=Hyphomonas sp. TaxID=87 RepID=UPI0035288D8F